MPLPSKNQRLKIILSLILTLASTLSVGYVIWGWIRHFPGAAMSDDEGLHAYHLTRAASQLAAGSLGGFLRAGLTQVVYPPGYSWLAAPLVLLFGAERHVLLSFSLLWFLLATLVAWRAAARLTPQRPGVAGLIAALLMLTSAPLLLFASNILLDSVGVCVVFVFLNEWAGLRAESPRWQAIVVGLSAGLTFLIKYPFRIFVGVTLGVAALLEMLRQKSWRLPANDCWLLGSAAFVVGSYLALPGRLVDMLLCLTQSLLLTHSPATQVRANVAAETGVVSGDRAWHLEFQLAS